MSCRTPRWLLAGVFVCGFVSIVGCRHADASNPVALPSQQAADAGDELAAAFDELVEALRLLEDDIRKMPSFGDEAERVGGYRHVLRAFAKGMEAEILQDADYPYFRILDWWLREGGDNPDQRYAFSPVRGGETYRIWGELGSATRVEFQLYAGRPWDGTGRSAGFYTFEELQLEEDGSFELWVSAEPREGNWLSNPEDVTTLFVRHIYGDWNEQRTGDVHIDRVGYEGRRRPQESADELAQRMRAAAVMFSATARNWPRFVAHRYMQGRPGNQATPPIDTYRLGGAKGRWMSGGYFELAQDEALVVRVPKTRAPYQAIQLTDMWYASLEHGNQVSSLTTTQSHESPDGAFYYVISGSDPGHVNWLDTGALRRGTFMLRWDGVQGALSESEFPSSQVLPIDRLEEAIPGFTRASEEEREATRAARRRHLQLRSHR